MLAQIHQHPTLVVRICLLFDFYDTLQSRFGLGMPVFQSATVAAGAAMPPAGARQSKESSRRNEIRAKIDMIP
ncbi:hypothetical protein ASD15_19420 [Massilia sp. Root351]|jgi:hypothetical protein|nr:hypothetical protein ASD15_19420 [Massilia sp. Root351]